jgi:hypothetical protein
MDNNIVTIRLFEDKGIPAHVTRPLQIRTQEDKKTWVPTLYKQGWKDKTKYQKVKLQDLQQIQDIGVVVTTNNLLIVDFDTNTSYEDALHLNNALPGSMQCGYIVHSTRKGGHFYYYNTPPKNKTQISPLHSDKSVISLDILTGDGHNAFAPTKGDPSKELLEQNTNTLITIPDAMIYYINSIILREASKKAKQSYLVSKEGYSDDNYAQIEQFIAGLLPLETFCEFYNVPTRMPEGQSWSILQTLSYRLLRDETIKHEQVLATLQKYDPEFRQEHSLLAPYDNNKYDEARKGHSLVVQHRDTKTPVTAYFDLQNQQYLVHYKDKFGQPLVIEISTEAKLKAFLEATSGRKRTTLVMPKIQPVNTVYDYTLKGGYDGVTNTFNKCYMNKHLTAFKGTKPEGYTKPQGLIDLTKYMWGDEWEYLLASTQWRFRNFEHSAVVTHIMGTEGSGKNLTVNLLTKGFSGDNQELDYTLFMDKHANHQVQPNTILGEVGDWNPAEKKGALGKIKTQSGNQGKTTIRGMATAATVVDTINKIWVLGNSWMRLHTDPNTQRRVHAVYMPQPLKIEAGGRYEANEIEHLLSDEQTINFYYWLGNEFTPEEPFTKTEFDSAICRQRSQSYRIYVDAVEGTADSVVRLVATGEWEELCKALALVERDVSDLKMKWSKKKTLVISANSVKMCFSRIKGSDSINKAIDTMCSNFEGNKSLAFDGSPEKYITVWNAPHNVLQSIATEELAIKT